MLSQEQIDKYLAGLPEGYAAFQCRYDLEICARPRDSVGSLTDNRRWMELKPSGKPDKTFWQERDVISGLAERVTKLESDTRLLREEVAKLLQWVERLDRSVTELESVKTAERDKIHDHAADEIAMLLRRSEWAYQWKAAIAQPLPSGANSIIGGLKFEIEVNHQHGWAVDQLENLKRLLAAEPKQ